MGRGRSVGGGHHLGGVGGALVVQGRDEERCVTQGPLEQHQGRVPVLVAQAGIDGRARAQAGLAHMGQQGGHAVGIVGAVQQQGRMLVRGGHGLQTAGHEGPGQSPRHGIGPRRHMQARGQGLPGVQGHGGIDALVRPGQPQRHVARQGFDDVQGSGQPFGLTAQDLFGSGELGRADHRHAGADGAALVQGDVSQGGAQDGGMIHGHGREAGQVAGQGRGGIMGAAQPGLHDGQLHALTGKGQYGQHGQEFEIGQIRSRRVDFRGQPGPQVFLQRDAVDADALAGGKEVRRGIEPGAAAVGAGQAVQKGGRGALAVGAHDLGHHKGRAGKAQAGEGGLHARQAQVHVEETKTVQVFPDLVDGREMLCSLHAATMPQFPVLVSACAKGKNVPSQDGRTKKIFYACGCCRVLTAIGGRGIGQHSDACCRLGCLRQSHSLARLDSEKEAMHDPS